MPVQSFVERFQVVYKGRECEIMNAMQYNPGYDNIMVSFWFYLLCVFCTGTLWVWESLFALYCAEELDHGKTTGMLICSPYRSSLLKKLQKAKLLYKLYQCKSKLISWKSEAQV